MIQKSVTKIYIRAVPYAQEILLGKKIDDVTSIGKNLFIVFEGDVILRSHSKMFGTWHLYSHGVTWKRSARNVVAIIEAGDVVAVAFDVPLIQLGRGVERTLGTFRTELGSDLIRGDIDVEVAFERFKQFSKDVLVGEALLDQRVVSGIGNIYRCETLFKTRISPYRPASSISVEELGAMLEVARVNLNFNARENSNLKRIFDDEVEGTFVYGRGGLPCHICGKKVIRKVMGAPSERVPRPIFYCPNCQL